MCYALIMKPFFTKTARTNPYPEPFLIDLLCYRLGNITKAVLGGPKFFTPSGMLRGTLISAEPDTFLIIPSHVSEGGSRKFRLCVYFCGYRCRTALCTTHLHCAPPTCFVHHGAHGRPMSVRSIFQISATPY